MLASVHRRPPPSATCPNTTGAAAGERWRTGVNETETETGGRAASPGQHAWGATARERRGDLLGAEPGPVPADRGGQPSSACKSVLAGLANHAGPDGTGAFPSVATLVRYTGLSERTVRTRLDRLETEGIISPCDPASSRPGKFFHALGPGWRLTAAQRSRLTPAVLAALDEGWAPHELAGSPGRTPAASGTRTRCWPSALGCRAAPAARTAAAPAAVVRRMRRAHPDGRLLQRRAEPLPALQAGGPHAAAQPQPRQPSPPASRSYAAGDRWGPGGPAQSPATTPQRCARCHL
jgi:hypothetical protein